MSHSWSERMDEQERVLRQILREQQMLFRAIDDADRAARAEAKRQELDALIWQESLPPAEQRERLETILRLFKDVRKYGRRVRRFSEIESETWAVDQLIQLLSA